MKNKNVSFRDVFCFPRKKCEQFDFLFICKLVNSGGEVFDSVFVAFCCCHFFSSVSRTKSVNWDYYTTRTAVCKYRKQRNLVYLRY